MSSKLFLLSLLKSDGWLSRKLKRNARRSSFVFPLAAVCGRTRGRIELRPKDFEQSTLRPCEWCQFRRNAVTNEQVMPSWRSRRGPKLSRVAKLRNQLWTQSEFHRLCAAQNGNWNNLHFLCLKFLKKNWQLTRQGAAILFPARQIWIVGLGDLCKLWLTSF